MPLNPLTHHEIMALVEPFARAGYHVDLTASNRQFRRIAFKPIEHAATPKRPKLTEVLHLRNYEGANFALERRLTAASGLASKLETRGTALKDLLERISAVPLERAFSTSGGATIAESYRIETSGSVYMDIERMTLDSAAAIAGGLAIKLSMSNVARYPAEIELKPQNALIKDLPDDLLAVLGRDFGILDQTDKGWKTRIKMPGREPDRSRRAEKSFRTAVTHIAATLSQAPSEYHRVHSRARWRAAFRRALPLVICTAMLALAASISKFGIDPNSSMQLLLFNLPGLLLLGVFGMRELPRLELPRVPKPLRAEAWQPSRATPIEEQPALLSQAAE